MQHEQNNTQGALQFSEGCPVGHVLEWAKTAGQLTQV